MKPRIIVQYVQVVWTKASRGNPGASRRNAVAQAFELPADIVDSAAPVQVHAVSAAEHADFVPVRTADIWAGDGSSLVRVGCACIAIEATGVRLRFEYDGAHGGAPFRKYLDSTGTLTSVTEDVGLLSPGEWARVEWNGRFVCSDTGDWWYELNTVNVALVEVPSPELFLIQQPLMRYAQRAELS